MGTTKYLDSPLFNTIPKFPDGFQKLEKIKAVLREDGKLDRQITLLDAITKTSIW